MSVSAKFFTEILEEEIKLWQESAVRCDSVIVLLSAERQKIEWIMIAASYRQRARHLQKMIDELKGAEGSR